MLSVGNQTLTNPDGSVLRHREIFGFLWEQFLAHPNAAFVGFSLGYDFTQWLKSIQEHEAYMLLHRDGIAARKRRVKGNPEPFPVYVDGEWEIDILAGKRFKLVKHVHHGPTGTNEGKNYDHCRCGSRLPYPDWNRLPVPSGTDVAWSYFRRKPHSSSRMFVCDTFPFHQTSFIGVIDPEKWEGVEPVATEEEYQLIREGKDKRSSYTDVAYGRTDYFSDMARYNRAENAALARVCDRLNRGLVAIGLNLDKQNWYGPGRAAQAWLEHLHPKSEIGPRSGQEFSRLSRALHHETLEPWQVDIGRMTYYGGWFEQFVHGHIPGRTWEYDLNSAYPAEIAKLPCLLHGQWDRGYGEPPEYATDSGVLTAVLGDVHGSDRYMGPLPCRTSTGAIVRPHHTDGWYWLDEINAARSAGLVDTVNTREWVSYRPCECTPPLAEISNLYNRRLVVGKNTPDGKSLKLVYNSAYGKFAQSIGSPRFANGIYASRITAGCRIQILKAIATHPQKSAAVTMIATDGIYFTSRHPNLPLSPDTLGLWDETAKDNVCQLMPGIYWDDKARIAVQEGRPVKVKSRGISPRDLAASMFTLDDMFDDFRDMLRKKKAPEHWPMMGVKVEFAMVTAKQAVLRGDWSLAGMVSHDGIRYLDSRPVNKRDWTRPYMWRGLVRTPVRVLDNPETIPYPKMFGAIDEMELLRETLGWGVTPTGDVSDQIWEYFGGR
jgi:hypothetical protein